MAWTVVEDGIVAVVLDPGVWGFTELESAQGTSLFSKFGNEGFPEDMDTSFGSGVGVNGLVKVMVVPTLVEFITHDELKLAEVKKESLLFPGVFTEYGALGSDFQDVRVAMIS